MEENEEEEEEKEKEKEKETRHDVYNPVDHAIRFSVRD